MYGHGSTPGRGDGGSVEVQLWVLACLGFVVGDVVTTGIGLGVVGVTEANPIAASLFEHSLLGGMAALKLAVCSVGYVAWRYIPRPHCVGVPLGLATLGAMVTGWNLHVITQALLH